MISYAFDLYPRTDPLGARLVRFSKLQSATYRGEANGSGAGQFTVRATNAEADSLDPDGLQYVRVMRVDDSIVDGATLSGFDELVVGGFFTESGQFEVLIEDETKIITWGGAGPLNYLQRAVMDADSWIDDPFIGTDPQPDGTWPLHLAGTGNELGAILWRVLHELEEPGRHQNPLPAMSLGFTHLLDSNGAAWVRTTGDFVAQVSDSVLLPIAKRLMQLGLYVEVDVDTFEVRAYEPETHRRDRTGVAWGALVVRFQAPIGGDITTGNIKSNLSRALEAKVRRNAILTGSNDTWLWVLDPSVTVPWEGGYILDDEDGTSLLKAGEAQLAQRGDAGDTARLRMKLGNDPANGRYKPFESDGVLLDDLVTVHTGTGQWDYNEAEFPVAALTISLRPGGDWDAWADLGSTYLSMAERAFQAQPVGSHTHPPNPQLCRPGTPPSYVHGDGSTSGTVSGFESQGVAGEVMYAFVQEVPGFPVTLCQWQRPTEPGPPASENFTFVTRITNGSSIIAVVRLLNPGAGVGQIAASIGTGSCLVGVHHVIGRTSEAVTTNSGTSTTSSMAVGAGGGLIVDMAAATGAGAASAPTAGGGQTSEWSIFTTAGETDVAQGGSYAGDNPTWTFPASAPWVSVGIVVSGGAAGDIPQSVGANSEADVGTSVRASRCDHVHDHSDLSDHPSETHHHASSVEFTPHGSIAATNVQAAIQEVRDEASSGAPTTADYLVGTANAGLSAEIVVGTTPGGELGGTWASPTVDATHAGSTHFALGAWTTFSPTFSTSGGGGAIGDGTLVGRWKELDGTTALVSIHLTWGSTSTAGTGNFQIGNLPFTVRTGTPLIQVIGGVLIDSGTASFVVAGRLTQGSTACNLTVVADATGTRHAADTIPVTWATGDQIILQGWIETD